MPVVTEETVRAAAHQIWLEEGCPEGRAQEHWLMAVATLEKADEPKNKRTPARSRKKSD